MFGTAMVTDVLREGDPDVLLALTATNQRMVELRDAQYKRQAQHLAHELGKVLAQIWS